MASPVIPSISSPMNHHQLEEISNFLATTQPNPEQSSGQSHQVNLSLHDNFLNLSSADSFKIDYRNSSSSPPNSNIDQASLMVQENSSQLIPPSTSNRFVPSHLDLDDIQAYVDSHKSKKSEVDLSNPSGAIACSSQHIIATASNNLQLNPSAQDSNKLIILFSLFPIASRPTPSWSFTLPSPTFPTLKPHSLTPANPQPSHPAGVDHLWFSPDGTHLLISSHTSSSRDGIQHLRLSILIQDSAQVDQWRLGWDEVVCNNLDEINQLDSFQLVPKRVRAARFLAEPRRWLTDFIPPDMAVPDEEISLIRSAKYLKPKRTLGRTINGLVQGKGLTALLVLSTNEIFVIHMPLPQMNLPPHVLLTTLSNSTTVAKPLKLTPSPSFVMPQKQHSTLDLNHPPSNPQDSQSTLGQTQLKSGSSTQPLGIDLPLNPTPPITNSNSGSGLYHSNPTNSQLEGSIDKFGSSTHSIPSYGSIGSKSNELDFKPGGRFDSNPSNQFDNLMNSFKLPRREIQIATIGFPMERRDSSDDVEVPPLLIAFKTLTKPIVPAPIKQTMITGISDGHKFPISDDKNQMGGSQFSMGEEDIGDYITGLGDLDDAFDNPLEQNFSNRNNPNENNNNEHTQKEVSKDLPHQNEKMEEDVLLSNKRKDSVDSRKQKIKRRRYEPIFGLDDKGHNTEGEGEVSDGFIELAEIFLDFDDSIIPTITLQLLSNLSIVDPFDHNMDCRPILHTLNFLEVELEPSNVKSPTIRLLATYSKSNSTENLIKFSAELQCWDARYERTSLSNGFLGLECFNEKQNNRKSNSEILQGPEEWVINRSVNKKLDSDYATICKICNIIPNWKGKIGSFLIFIKKTIIDHENSKENCRDQFECLILNSGDLSTLEVKLLSSIEEEDLRKLCISFHGIWCCTMNKFGKVRASPLITSEQPHLLVGLIMGAIYNREPADDIVRLLSYKVDENNVSQANRFDYSLIFDQISGFIASLSIGFRNYELDPLIHIAWNLGYDIWSAIPGYENAAEFALIGRWLSATLTMGTSVKQETYSRSLWQMIGFARWYLRLCHKIISSTEPNSPTPHLCLLPLTSFTFFYLFKMALLFTSFSQWLLVIKPNNFSPRFASSKSGEVSLNDEVELAKSIFNEIWDHQNPIHMESWGKLLQDIGPTVIPKPSTDLSKMPLRHVESFSAPLATLDLNQVEEAVMILRKSITKHPQLIKTEKHNLINFFNNNTLKDDLKTFDIISGERIQNTKKSHNNQVSFKQCIKCQAKSKKKKKSFWNQDSLKTQAGNSSNLHNEKDFLSPFEFSSREFFRKCICSGFWVSSSS
ncbi:hypothetical protein O181_052158 [Austropuccinia psidii MF-1]|uniref:Uncharacterized protein n=1 Tax=Austropuccinia psidii MF-1 TaxID=1389203 RepID=A0A9Q3E4Z4_9BASI|nr:hypothetical protein [Austropuccinia psidii MF-1]